MKKMTLIAWMAFLALASVPVVAGEVLDQPTVQSVWTTPGTVLKVVSGAPFTEKGVKKQYADVTIQNSSGDCILNNALFRYRSGQWALDQIQASQMVSCKTGKAKSGGMSDAEKASLGVNAAGTAAGIARWGW